MKRILQIMFAIGLVAGVMNMIIGWAVTFGVIAWGGELPWYGVQGVRCHQGRTYVGLAYFSSVLVYDELGEHVGTIPVPTHGKPYFFRVQQEGGIHVIPHHAPSPTMGGFRSGTERLERYLEFRCGNDDRVLRQSVLWLVFAGPIPGALVGFLSVLGLLALMPGLQKVLFDRSK